MVARKETGISFVEALEALGASAGQIAAVEIEVKREAGPLEGVLIVGL